MSTWSTQGVLQQAVGNLFAPEQTNAANTNLDTSLISTIGKDAHLWDRKDWRRWRKQHGLSKQEMRNVRAQAIMGMPAPEDVSRKDLRRIENQRKEQGNAAMYYNGVTSSQKDVNTLTNFFANNAKAIVDYNNNGTEVPIVEVPEVPEVYQEVEVDEKPIVTQQPTTTPVQQPITYDWAGSGLNSYWQKQNQMVLDGLSDDQKLEISGGDGVISAEDARAWQNKMGAGTDLKFGQNTIGAMNTQYGIQHMQDFKNPASKNGSPVFNKKNYKTPYSTPWSTGKSI